MTCVSTVRDRVSLMERSSSSTSGMRLYLRKFSRIAVEDHDLVVERVADDGQDRGNARQIEFELKERIKADRAGHVVNQRGDGGHGELPFEPEPDIDQDADHGDDDSDGAARDQLARDGRPHDLDAAILDPVAERLLDFGDGGLLLLLGGLRGNADQDIVRRAELLNLHLADTETR